MTPSIHWIDVSVAVVLSLLANGVILALVFVFVHCRRHGKKRRAATKLVDVSTVSNSAKESTVYKALPTDGNRLSDNRNISAGDRRKRDDVSQWCSERGLPEMLVMELRGRRFDTRAALDALRPEDVTSLQLSNAAAAVQLRRALETLHSHHTNCPGQIVRPDIAPRPSHSSSGRASQTSDYSSHKTPSTADDSRFSPNVFAPLLEHTRSVERLQSYEMSHRQGNVPTALSMGTIQQAEENDKGFHGLLSNAGLWQLAGMIGREWRHLATLLNVSQKRQERLLEDNPRNTQQAIVEMLRGWRDEAPGGKERVKGALHSALLSVQRRDIAEKLMAEQVHGSNTTVNNRPTSIL